MNALAIDLGTTAAKVSVVAENGRILGSGTEVLTTVYGRGGVAEQDAELVWQAVRRAASQALHEAGASARLDVRVVCATSQWSSIVPVGPTGLPLSPMLMWLDRRGAHYTAAITANDPDAGEHWATVHGLHPSTSLAHVLFVQHDRPSIHAKAAAYLEPMDYLNARLCGRLVATACTSMPFALTDQRTLGAVTWSDDLIHRAGVDASKLPELVPSMSVVANVHRSVAEDLGIRPETVVVAGANDSVAAAIGTNAIAPGRGTVVMGTTGVLTGHHPTRVVDASKFLATMPSALNDRFYVMAEAGLGGKVLETFLNEVVAADDSSVRPRAPSIDLFDRAFRAIAHIPAGADGLLFLPWLVGSAAPKIDGRHRGAFLGISMQTTRAHMVRAVLEGVALQMRWLTDEVEATLGQSYETLRFAGGGAQSDVWAQTMADVLGRPIEQVHEPRHANARGAGLLGLLSLDRIGVDDLDPLVPIARRYEPALPSAALFDERIDIYRDLHGRLAEPVARLSARPT
jgi:xylulokinase